MLTRLGVGVNFLMPKMAMFMGFILLYKRIRDREKVCREPRPFWGGRMVVSFKNAPLRGLTNCLNPGGPMVWVVVLICLPCFLKLFFGKGNLRVDLCGGWMTRVVGKNLDWFSSIMHFGGSGFSSLGNFGSGQKRKRGGGLIKKKPGVFDRGFFPKEFLKSIFK